MLFIFLLICRGTSQDNRMEAFHSKLYELRSLAPNVPIRSCLDCNRNKTDQRHSFPPSEHAKCSIKESPNKLNVAYVVQYMDKDMELDELKQSKEKTERTIIYCQTIRQCGLLYAKIKALLGECIFIGNDSKHVLVEMLHSCTPEANKHNILESFQSGNGSIHLLIATIAFGMGVDCRGVHRVMHFGPSKNVKSYVGQEGMTSKALHLFYTMELC